VDPGVQRMYVFRAAQWYNSSFLSPASGSVCPPACIAGVTSKLNTTPALKRTHNGVQALKLVSLKQQDYCITVCVWKEERH